MKFNKLQAYRSKTQIDLWSKYQHKLSLNRKSSKTWIRAKGIRNSTKELLLWRRKSTS